MRLRVVNLMSITAGNIEYIELPAPVETVTDDHILGGVQWTTDNEIAALWLNRRQNSTVLKICNIAVTPITCQVGTHKVCLNKNLNSNVYSL